MWESMTHLREQWWAIYLLLVLKGVCFCILCAYNSENSFFFARTGDFGLCV